MSKGFLPSTAASLLLALLISISAATSFAAAQDGEPRVLTTAKAIRELTPDQMADAPPVNLRGVVTYHDPVGPNLFVQDSTAGIWVDLRGLPTAPKLGDFIDLQGVVGSGFSPYVAKPKWQVLRRAPLPEPRIVAYHTAVDGTEDSQWVEMQGIVRSFVKEAEGNVLVIDVGTAGGSFKVRIPSFPGPFPMHLVDAAVAFRGVCGTAFNRQGQLVAVHMFVPNLDYVRVLDPANPQPFSVPTVSIASLGRFSARRNVLHRTKVKGLVTAQFKGFSLFIKDATGGLEVQSDDGTEVKVGDEVEAVGFAAVGDYTPVLRSARFRATGRHEAVEPTSLTAREALRGAYDAQLIQVEGVIQADNSDANGVPSLILESENILFDAFPRQSPAGTAWPQVPRGSRVRLNGVCSIKIDENGNPAQFRVILRNPSDIVVISRPPWLNMSRLMALLGLFAVGHLLGILWVWGLRRRVRKQTDIIREQLENDARREQQMLQMQKMEAIGRLAGGVAHDFNNLLTVIISYSSLLTSSFAKDSSEHRRLQAIEEAAHKAAALTHQLLAYSRKQLLEPKVIEIDSLIRNLEKMLRRLIRENVELSTNLRCGFAAVTVDPVQMEQVLINIAVNARDAMPQGGQLFIETECVRIESATQDAAVPPGSYIVISVRDTGVGMDVETQERAFEPFFTTKEFGKGTGLGLAMVDGFVKQSGGYITLRSSPGSGSTFSIYLPAIIVRPAVDASAHPDGSVKGTGTILLVEDEEEVRALLAEILTGLGYYVVQACNGQDALDQVAKSQMPFDLVITDLIMPKMGGSEFGEQLKKLEPNMPLLFISGHTDAVPSMAASRLLRKPFKPEDLGRKVADIIAASRAARNAVRTVVN